MVVIDSASLNARFFRYRLIESIKVRMFAVEELERDLDSWLYYCNHERSHVGKFCYDKPPTQSFYKNKKFNS